MSGSIVRAIGWDVGIEQNYLAVSPTGEEVALYRTDSAATNEDENVVKVYSRENFEHIQCNAYSRTDFGLTAVGQLNGTVCVFDISTSQSSVLKLRPKQSRPCNSLSFNSNGLLAVGFDKGRQDNSIQIWNIEHYSKTSNNDHITKPTYSYIPNEAILSTVFHPNMSTNLLAGSYKFLREIDIRTDVPVFQLATRCTLGITVDPFDSNFFTSFSEGGSLSIWDRRKLTANVSSTSTSAPKVIADAPMLYFNNLLGDSSRKNYSSCFRYSTIRKGEFSAVFSGEWIRRWQTGVVPPLPQTNRHEPRIPQPLPVFKEDETSIFVASVLDTKTRYERVVSFDYAPDIHSSTANCFVCMRQSGSVFKMSLSESCGALKFNSFNEFSVCGPNGTFTRFLDDSETEEQAKMNNTAKTDSEYADNYEESIASSAEAEEVDEYGDNNERRNSKFLPLDSFLDVSDVLGRDICSIMRKRALSGYGLDCGKNLELIEAAGNMEAHWFLRNTWKWMLLAKKSLDKGDMIGEGLDLGFQGVWGLWNGTRGFQQQQRYHGNLTEGIYSHAVESIVSSKGKSKKTANINIKGKSDRKTQRKLCLDVAGWDFGPNELESKLNTLMAMGMHEKAAGWAVFHGDVPKAVEILASSKKERLRLMSTAVAGYMAYKDSDTNSPWKDQCRRMASELDDPYLRAIFAFIADNDWLDVLDEHALPLRERLGVALRFLSDKELTVYLDRVVGKVTKRGELEGIILTGVTPQGVELIQSYVDRTSDVQTASLIASFGCPRYFKDERVDHWIDCYRNLLNSWSLFNVRAKFDVSRTKLSKTNLGQITIQTAPRQVYLQCTRCNKNISKNRGNATTTTVTNAMKQFNKSINTVTHDKEYKSCPHCGAPLPRCAVCLLSLGMPIPLDNSESAWTAEQSVDPKDVESRKNERYFKEWFSFCLSCNHASHAFHAEEWFSKHYVCPVPDCNCRCNSK